MDKLEILIAIGMFLLATTIGSAIWVTKSHFEAQSYNKLTNSEATTWDAMWVQLRVDGNK